MENQKEKEKWPNIQPTNATFFLPTYFQHLSGKEKEKSEPMTFFWQQTKNTFYLMIGIGILLAIFLAIKLIN